MMEFGGGYCITRYKEGGYDTSKVDRIMLRFRPIAPKPTMGGCGLTPESGGMEVLSESVKRKGKPSRVKSNKGCKRRRRNRKSRGGTPMVTLPLLPEAPEPKERAPVGHNTNGKKTLPFWLILGDETSGCARQAPAIEKDGGTSRGVMTSCVTVESVSDVGMLEGIYGLGNSDEERKRTLENDFCPGFISDSVGQVTWINTSYRKLVGDGDEGGKFNRKMMVWLMMRERPMITSPTFACRVRLQYKSRDNDWSSLTLPCDVYRMDDGGFAWRLDVKAALSLGRSYNR